MNETDRDKRTDGRFEVRFSISGHQVCKDFYREATGFSEKLFNDVYREVVEGLEDKCSDIHKLLHPSKHEDREDEIIAFLDRYFKSEATITGKPLAPSDMNYLSKPINISRNGSSWSREAFFEKTLE